MPARCTWCFRSKPFWIARSPFGFLRAVICAPLFAYTCTLAIGGEGLTVSELSVKTGEVKINGSIEYVQYTAKREKQESLFKRLVR